MPEPAGRILGLLQVPVDGLVALLEETFGGKGAEVVAWNREAARHGFEMGKAQGKSFSLAGSPSRRNRGS